MHPCTHIFLQTLSRTSFRGCLYPVSHPDTDIYTRRPEKRNPRSCDSLHAGPRNTPFTLNRSASTDKPTNKSTGWNSSPWQQTWKVSPSTPAACEVTFSPLLSIHQQGSSASPEENVSLFSWISETREPGGGQGKSVGLGELKFWKGKNASAAAGAVKKEKKKEKMCCVYTDCWCFSHDVL